ncbi:MAG: M48 family metallopeptidase [Elusimicrobiota bacterium]|jgi:Zn-dependent protease with chaperone function|nr:M48 family metallopeptidase [Elusimicrobiota bacterium]
MKNDADFRARQLELIENNVNAGKEPPWREALKVTAGFAAILAALYIIIGIAVGIYVNAISFKTQKKIESLFAAANPSAEFKGKEYAQAVSALREISAQIAAQNRLPENYAPDIGVVYSRAANAFLTPGGKIYFTTALLDNVKNKEALAFVLAHEIGHYVNRDHLKAMGRGLALSVVKILFSGDSSTGVVSGGTDAIARNSYSRGQEREADAYAQKVCTALYGSADGGIEFFEYMEAKDKLPEFISYLSTHPSTRSRIQKLRNN